MLHHKIKNGERAGYWLSKIKYKTVYNIVSG